jgi:hypothetical protein
MKPETYAALLKDLQKLQKNLVASQIAAVRRDVALSARMARLHAEAEVGGRLDDFVATAARKSTVLFLLRTVFVRVLEDLGILGLKRIRGDWGFAAFREIAPALDHRAYFAFVFRDLAIDFPALFSPGEDELPLPDEDGCVDLWELWHHPNRAGEHYVWNGDGFDSRFLGDLYQDLDKDIRKRYALLQTPRFVEEYILDHALTPALKDFDLAELREKGETFRLVDPTCGSGHFLIGAFQRLADHWRDRHGLSEWEACERSLESVWGCDINPHAVDIAAFRLLLEVVARTGVKDLDQLARLKLNLRAMDSLIPWERAAAQAELFPGHNRLMAYGTVKERAENAAFLGHRFHAVVGNPPYIQPKDDQKTADYRAFWPLSAKGHYALSGPFFERFFQLGTSGAHVGFITAKAFTSSEYGESLVRQVVPRIALRRIVDSSRVTIPGHGTPTLLVFGRNSPRDDLPVEFVTVSRGEQRRLSHPETGIVWTSLVAVSSERPAVGLASLTLIERAQLDSYPWELADPLETEVLERIKSAPTSLAQLAADFGYSFQTNCDEVFLIDAAHARRLRVQDFVRSVCAGEGVRDYSVGGNVLILSPYDGVSLMERLPVSLYRAMWKWRTTLYGRVTFSGGDYRSQGRAWFQWHQFSVRKHRTPLSIVFSDVVTHNHFALDRGGRVFSRHSPVIKLKSQEVDDHWDLLGLLGSSVAAFWIRRTFRSKGAQGVGEGIKTELWEQFVEPDSSKIGRYPVAVCDRSLRVSLAQALDQCASEREGCLSAVVFSTSSEQPLDARLAEARVRYTQLTERMVALQEELDWLAYRSYGLVNEVRIDEPSSIAPLAPGHRPFEVVLARSEEEVDTENRSTWWTRHGHKRVVEIPGTCTEMQKQRIRERMDVIVANPWIGLLETPTYKRRWEPIDWDRDAVRAAEAWLLDRLENVFASQVSALHSARGFAPYRLEELVVAWSRDPQVVAAAGIMTGDGLSVDLSRVAEKLLRANAVPDNPNRLYSAEGLRKLEEWKRVSFIQDQEDAWEAAVADAKANCSESPVKRIVDPDDPSKELDSIPLPPKFEKSDFVKAEYFSLRGKLDVPRERFIIFSDLSPPRFGWNGWRDRERALAQVEAFTLAENDPHDPLPVPTTDDPRRCGVTIGLWESLPDVKRWGSADEYEELLSLAQEACRRTRCPCPVLDAWRAKVLSGEARDGDAPVPASSLTKGKGKGKGKGRGKKATPDVVASAVEVIAERTVSVEERAWIAGLLEAGHGIDLASLWAAHQRRVDEATASARGGSETGQLRFLEVNQVDPALPAHLRTIDAARLAMIVDDLVASGDLAVRGRGKKKRYQLVPRMTRA